MRRERFCAAFDADKRAEHASGTASRLTAMRLASLSLCSSLTALSALGCASGDPSIARSNDATEQSLVCTPSDHPLAPSSLLTRAQYDATIADLMGDSSR